MPCVTIYCVQPYWNDGRRLARGLPEQFTCRRKAVRAGRRAARRNCGAVVFSVRGDPEIEAWGEPRVISALGDLPWALSR